MLKIRLFYYVALLLPIVSGDLEDESEDICTYLGGSSSDCKPLRQCKPLLELIKNRPLLKTSLGVLVNLTCEFHLTEPRVCCPPEDQDAYLESEEFSPSAIHTTLKPSLPTNSHFPIDYEVEFQSHRNFGKIPAFEKCSLSLTSYVRKGRIGKQTFRGQFPWVALLGYKNTSTGEINFLCGATVITKRHLLTSAQCTNLARYGLPVRVRLAEHDLATDPDCLHAAQLGCSTALDVEIKQIHVHNAFNFTAARKEAILEHDIAVVALRQDLIFDLYTQPICLPFVRDYNLLNFPKRMDSISTSYAAGWQKVTGLKTKQSTLELSTFPVIPNEECEAEYYNETGLKPNQICAGNDFPSECCVNIGSALMISHIERSMNKYFQIGIASYGPFQCHQKPTPGLFTKVTPYLNFILDSLD